MNGSPRGHAVWDPGQYHKFGDHRLRPALELFERAMLALGRREPGAVYDLGCGGGEITRIMAERWPETHVVGLDSSAEMLRKAQRIENLTGEALELVGHHRHRDLAPGKLGQHLVRMRIGLRVDRVVFGVIGEHLLVELAEFVVRQPALLIDRLFEHDLGPAADQVACMVGGDRVETAQFERMVDGRTEIAMRFEQGSVEVEADDGEWQVGHWRKR